MARKRLHKILAMTYLQPAKLSKFVTRHASLVTILVLCCFICSGVYCQSKTFQNFKINSDPDSPVFMQVKTDSLFHSRQIISTLTIQKSSLKNYAIEFGYSRMDLKKTSTFGRIYNAEAAVNGSFFDRDHGGSVTYLEVNDSVISTTRPSGVKWAMPDSIINGAIILTRDHEIILQPARSDKFYSGSRQEAAVMVSGPLLLYHSEPVKLAGKPIVNKRHPRTCLCMTAGLVKFITIDGRSTEAEGMSLPEVQVFLKKTGCIDAINLDGGGSTTMWIKNKGVVNSPSDITGERPVANVLLIKRIVKK